MPNIVGLLKRISNQLPLLDATRAGSELYGAPRLNAFTLFEPNENSLSRIVEDIIDPNGSHGQGTTFLNALLSEIGLPIASAGDPVRTRREAPTAEGRRIDLLVETPKVLLGFENKPWAGQQPQQLRDYLVALKAWSRGRQYALVFLSDQEPETAKEEVIILPFAAIDGPSLTSVLQRALDRVKASRARIHIEEFVQYVNWQFGDGAMIHDSDLPYVEAVEAEFREGEHRKSVAAVLLAASQLHTQVLDEIGDCLLSALTDVADDFAPVGELKLSECLAEKWSPWELRRPSWPSNLSIALDANRTGFGQIAFGVKAPDPTDKEVKADGSGCPARPNVEVAVRSFGGGGKTKWWPWWKYVATRQWGQAFAAGIILHSPTGRVEDHPEIAELRNSVLDLAQAINNAVNPV